MLTATSAFMDAMEKWLKAVRANDFGAAKFHAKDIVLAGELLVIHPEFRRAFQQHCPDRDPKEALVDLCHFLVCTTDGRARVLTERAEDNQPEMV
jgi:hypothetical protein